MKPALIALGIVALLGVGITLMQSSSPDLPAEPVLQADDVAARLHDLGFPDARFHQGSWKFIEVEASGTRERCASLEGELRKLRTIDCLIARCGSISSHEWVLQLVRYDDAWYAPGARPFTACQ